MKKTASKKTEIAKIHSLVDCYMNEEINEQQLSYKVMKVIGRPIIQVSEMEYMVEIEGDNVYLNCRAICIDGTRDNWCQVSDLTDFTVGEYNNLVAKLNEHYPYYPIDYLDGRFV